MAPQMGGNIIIGARGTPQSMNLYDGGRDIPVAFDHFYEPLVSFDHSVDHRIDFPILPWLAEKWEQKDETTWDFTVRSGVMWHDGAPLTAEGVAWSLEFLRDPANVYGLRSNLVSVDKITVEPGNVVRLKLKSPSPGLLALVQALPIVPKHIFDAGGKDAVETRSTGTGPFSLVSFDRNSRVIFKKFPSYWRKDDAGRQQPYLDALEVVPNMDGATQQAAFAAKQLDIQVVPDKAQLDAFMMRAKDANVQPFVYASDASLIFNLKRPYLDKLEVRQALNLIINRQEILDNFAGGEGLFSLPGTSAMKDGYSITQDELKKRPGWGADKAAEIAQAKAQLAKAGVPADWDIKFLNHATYSNAPQGELAANQLRSAGLKITYEPVDDVSILKEERAGNYDVALELRANVDPTRAYNNFHTKGSSNFQSLSDPQIDAITEKLNRAAKKEEVQQLSQQLQRHILDQVYVMPLTAPALYTITQPWLHDYLQFSIQPGLSRSAALIWVEKEKMPAARK